MERLESVSDRLIMLSKEEKKQYHRHLILDQIGESGQLKLKQAKVLVIGAGGLGCPVLQYLTAAGVGTIGIIDGDRVESSNLQRQILFTVNDVAQFKAQVAAQKLSELNPFIQFNIILEYLSTQNAIELFQQYDIIVDGTDNFPTRYLTNDAAVLTGKPLVSASIFKFQGQLSVFNYKGSGTYRCLFPEAPPEGAVPSCSQVGVLGVLPGILGSLQANEALKIILELGDILQNKLLCINTLTLEQQILCFAKNSAIQISKLEQDYSLVCGEISPDILSISAKEFLENKSAYQLLDVRTKNEYCLLYTSPSPRDKRQSRMPSSA